MVLKIADYIPDVIAEEEAVKRIIRLVGEDPEREGLKETPQRFLAAMRFYTKGYREDPAKILKVFEDGAEDYDQLVLERNIKVMSLCEHHLAPFFGTACVAYIPDKKIVGLSKLVRLVDCFARRLQVQERITSQVAKALWEHLAPKAVGVVLECRHTCMEARGVCQANVPTITCALHGTFKDEPDSRAEFLQFVHNGR